MSGGSMDYLYATIEQNLRFEQNTPERKAFFKHMQDVIKALHDIEWVDSGDSGPGDDTEAILKCIGKERVRKSLVEEARVLADTLNHYYKEYRGV